VAGRSLTDFDTGVAILRELFDEELVELGVENAIGNELQGLWEVRTVCTGGVAANISVIIMYMTVCICDLHQGSPCASCLHSGKPW